MRVPFTTAEETRARFVELCPAGFEEVDRGDDLELAAYTDAAGERLLRREFTQVSAEDVQRGWEDRWREFHRPLCVDDVWIGAPWHEPPADGPWVVIDPGRAFGTGAHTTTQLCLRFLQRVSRGSCLDVGCGSGVLAVAAAKLGFAPVFAADIDQHAIEATLRNATANEVAIETVRADARKDVLPSADLTVANLTRDLVEGILPRLDCTHVIAAGYLCGDELAIAPFRRVDRITEAGWAADLLERAAQ